ncbi:bifunctional phosphoribosyl-AMP cyclohydrolase/phosphoribosyl-ATP diphosphatase HisIE [Chryseobacterium sp. 09-1422]|uniref:Histidine biosynthesis bifunctional protein HisIE n=1 Tax=Chryseobacterium kimseyorum TaxID=2984028 RepID=A0ABT3HTX7_9FLAO|nr:bifunctional phosphoribosyl-AMP cyclohydrolase/phosphoribosyl-ATP diphosphatase HisIE [Chryseobacterium kimseyorum]MCW3167247.1 bifunctional phosphoribosyl-AMP cyclohydrolase/phosphoribosyl-ATP diphosphatase HisIE [Chryseobacterium kimseyorum]
MKIDFKKTNGLVPVIIQDVRTLQVLMLGYMNEEAFNKTKDEGIVTFFSRSKNRLWTKGEESGNFLKVKNIQIDCDQDTVLIKVIPKNTVCHTGSFSCFGEKESKGFLYELESKIAQRIDDRVDGSYTYSLFQKGINKVAQKVGEEAVELVIEAKDDDADLFKNEAADLLYHFLILLKAKNFTLNEIEEILLDRNQ